jgi:hypothetical protein
MAFWGPVHDVSVVSSPGAVTCGPFITILFITAYEKGGTPMGIMSGIRRIFKGREKDRYAVTGKAFVVIAPSTAGERKVQILDIGQGGMAFVYEGSKEELLGSGIMQLLAENELHLEKVNFETVSDFPLEETGGQFRRRGVKFKWMGAFDQAKLRDFIKEVSTVKI